MALESVLITGAGGFVGRHLIRAILERNGVTVYGADHSPPSDGYAEGVLHLDCRLEDQGSVADAVRRSEPSVVYHLAAQSSVPASLSDPVGTFRANVMGTVHLLEALRGRERLRAVILISSAEVYGIVPESTLPVSEDSTPAPNNPYACSKLCAELAARQYWSSFSVPVVTVRPFNHIGPGQSDRFAASTFAKQIAEIEMGLAVPRILVGNLDARRDFTDVRDIVRAYLLAAERCIPGEVYNICSGESVSMHDILGMLLSLTEAKVEITPDPDRMRPSDLPDLVGDCAKFRKTTAWQPHIPLRRTLSDLLDYWRANARKRAEM